MEGFAFNTVLVTHFSSSYCTWKLVNSY